VLVGDLYSLTLGVMSAAASDATAALAKICTAAGAPGLPTARASYRRRFSCFLPFIRRLPAPRSRLPADLRRDNFALLSTTMQSHSALRIILQSKSVVGRPVPAEIRSKSGISAENTGGCFPAPPPRQKPAVFAAQFRQQTRSGSSERILIFYSELASTVLHLLCAFASLR
jgi:hypothetical protein